MMPKLMTYFAIPWLDRIAVSMQTFQTHYKLMFIISIRYFSSRFPQCLPLLTCFHFEATN
jgi:hypothetical protein